MSKERTLNEAQFKKLVRDLARKAIKEQVEAKNKEQAEVVTEDAKPEQKEAPKTQKITAAQLREMVRDSVLECLEEEIDKRLAAKKNAKK